MGRKSCIVIVRRAGSYSVFNPVEVKVMLELQEIESIGSWRSDYY